MWIFAYGSLMFDGWEAACGCIDRKWADLPGYRRSFNKKSIESRGAREVPGLTLNCCVRPATCAEVLRLPSRITLADKARMVIKAAGIRDSDFDYVRDTYEGLKGVGVDDPAVTALWEAIKK
jgi:glutathione-specific gamma-glutamylcyclotransferase